VDGYEFREYQTGDEQQLVDLFNLVFRADPDGPTLRTLAEWRWQFLDGPGGWRIWLALHTGRIVAQSAGIGYRACCEGRETRFSQSVDSLVHPEHRTGLKHPGLFVRTVLPYISAYGGSRDLVFFGWPNRAALRIGRAYLGYELVRCQPLLGRDPGSGPATLPEGVDLASSLDARVESLWRRCARHFGATALHDQAFLDWRFRRAPSRTYEFLGLNGAGQELQGLCVVHFSNWPLPRCLVISDWLVPEDEAAAGAQLRDAVLARARRLRAQAVVALFPPWSVWAGHFQDAGFGEHEAGIMLVSRSHDPRFGVAWLRDNWWYQLAESDLV
jgi:hypothetical protein